MIRRRRVELAAGIVLAGAFRTAMTSLINDAILPPISTLMAGTNISNLACVLKKSTGTVPPTVIGYGRFLQTTIDFMIIGATVILILRATEKVSEKVPPKPTKPSKQEALLTEIRDLLRVQANAEKNPGKKTQPSPVNSWQAASSAFTGEKWNRDQHTVFLVLGETSL